MPSCDRNPGKPVRAAFNPFATIEIPVCARPHRRQSSPSISNRTCLQARFRWLCFLYAVGRDLVEEFDALFAVHHERRIEAADLAQGRAAPAGRSPAGMKAHAAAERPGRAPEYPRTPARDAQGGPPAMEPPEPSPPPSFPGGSICSLKSRKHLSRRSTRDLAEATAIVAWAGSNLS